MDLDTCILYCRRIITDEGEKMNIYYVFYILEYLLALKDDLITGVLREMPVVDLDGKEL